MRIGVTYLFELEATIDPDESLELPLFVVGLVVLVAVVAAAVAVVVGVAVGRWLLLLFPLCVSWLFAVGY